MVLYKTNEVALHIIDVWYDCAMHEDCIAPKNTGIYGCNSMSHSQVFELWLTVASFGNHVECTLDIAYYQLYKLRAALNRRYTLKQNTARKFSRTENILDRRITNNRLKVSEASFTRPYTVKKVAPPNRLHLF